MQLNIIFIKLDALTYIKIYLLLLLCFKDYRILSEIFLLPHFIQIIGFIKLYNYSTIFKSVNIWTDCCSHSGSCQACVCLFRWGKVMNYILLGFQDFQSVCSLDSFAYLLQDRLFHRNSVNRIKNYPLGKPKENFLFFIRSPT